jgi:hypothetical protein
LPLVRATPEAPEEFARIVVNSAVISCAHSARTVPVAGEIQERKSGLSSCYTVEVSNAIRAAALHCLTHSLCVVDEISVEQLAAVMRVSTPPTHRGRGDR